MSFLKAECRNNEYEVIHWEGKKIFAHEERQLLVKDGQLTQIFQNSPTEYLILEWELTG